MENTFEFYRDYHNVEEAKYFASLLKNNNIPHSLEETGNIEISEIIGQGLVPKAVLKVRPEDFKKVNDLLSEEIKKSTGTDFSEHYLNQLEIEELKDIFREPEKWTTEDITIAQIILKDRGVNTSEEEIKKLREERLEIIRKGKNVSIGMLVFHACCIIFGLLIHLVFYIGGMGMAFYYVFGKSTDIDGQKNYVYNERTREYGKFMFYGGFLAPVFLILFLKMIY